MYVTDVARRASERATSEPSLSPGSLVARLAMMELSRAERAKVRLGSARASGLGARPARLDANPACSCLDFSDIFPSAQFNPLSVQVLGEEVGW